MKTICFLFQKSVTTRAMVSLLTSFAVLSTMAAADRVWNAGTSSTNFNNGGNYTPTGTIDSSANLIFDTETNPGLDLTAGLGIDSLLIEFGGSGFSLGASNALTINNGGITVAASTVATFNNRISSNGGASQMTFTVGSGGSMIVNGLVTPINRPFYKKGAGLLYLEVGMGGSSENFLRNGTSLNIEEGTLEIGNAAQFEPGNTLASLAVNVGTSSTTATLKGGGSLVGVAGKPVTVTTFGAPHSIIEPAGDGALAIQNLDASSGATFKFDLGSDLIFGTGTLTGSTAMEGLVLDLSGGVAGVTYTLFNYTTLSGVDESDFLINTEGYVVDFWTFDGGLVQLQFSAVPEPDGYAMMALLLVAICLVKRRHGRREANLPGI